MVKIGFARLSVGENSTLEEVGRVEFEGSERRGGDRIDEGIRWSRYCPAAG